MFWLAVTISDSEYRSSLEICWCVLWWQSEQGKGLLTCSWLSSGIKLILFHIIILQLPDNRELGWESQRAITGRNHVSGCHLSLYSGDGGLFAFCPRKWSLLISCVFVWINNMFLGDYMVCLIKITSNNLDSRNGEKKELLGCGNRLWRGVSGTALSHRDKNPNWAIINHGPFIEAIGMKLCQLMSIMSNSIQGPV